MQIDTENKLREIFDAILHLNGAPKGWSVDTKLLGSLAELDSLAVMNVISGIEKEFGFSIYDDEINADVFATLGSLLGFVNHKLLEK